MVKLIIMHSKKLHLANKPIITGGILQEWIQHFKEMSLTEKDNKKLKIKEDEVCM